MGASLDIGIYKAHRGLGIFQQWPDAIGAHMDSDAVFETRQ